MFLTSKRNRGHLISALILAALVLLFYWQGRSMNYNWHWNRVWSSVINTQPQQFRANGDGIVSVKKDGTLTITYDNHAKPQVFHDYKTRFVYDGDMVFEGDVIASRPHWEFGTIAKGLWVTIKISFVSLIFAVLLGLVFGIMRVSRSQVAQDLALVYVEIIRGTPLLVQIFVSYFLVGTILHLDKFTAGVVALSVFTGSYVVEIIRSGIQSIANGQMEAARSLGMTYSQAMRYIILPQAVKRILPPLAGQFINLIKDSSLVSVISIVDLTKAGREVIAGNFHVFEIWFIVAGFYLIMTGSLSWGIQRLEKRLSASD